MAEVHHPELGTFKGILDGSVVSLRGLKYASLESGFAESRLVGPSANSHTDATSYGPCAISLPTACDMEQSLIQKSLRHDEFTMSVTECLNLNVVVPKESKGQLPVFVFFHGGGFVMGANCWPQYNLEPIVKLSITIGQPAIGISVNSRLGPYGYLCSQALSKAGIKPNRGLRDQRCALNWVQRYVAGFSGDPNKVTVVGESAGGVACTLNLLSKEPLFQQLVAMGGNSLVMQPLPSLVAEMMYNKVLKAVNIDEQLSSNEQVQKVLETAPEVFLAKITPDIALHPVIDGDIVTSSTSWADWLDTGRLKALLPGTEWCNRIMIGDCAFDGTILSFPLMPRKTDIASTFTESLSRTLTGRQEAIDIILNEYDINTEISDDAAMINILKCFSDIRFYASTVVIARSWPGPAHVYHFNEPNPWDGPWKGEAGHVLDIAFLLQNYNQHLDEQQAASARRFAEDFIVFVNMQEPYPAHDAQAPGARVYGPPGVDNESFVIAASPKSYGRRDTVWRLAAKTDFDSLARVVDNFLAGQ